MNVSELRGFLKERRIKGYSTLKKGALEAKVREIREKEEVAIYEQNLRDTAVCSACLEQQRIQRKIDSKTHDQRLFEIAVRTLVCEHCEHVEFAVDGDLTVCASCGALQSPDAVGGGGIEINFCKPRDSQKYSWFTLQSLERPSYTNLHESNRRA